MLILTGRRLQLKSVAVSLMRDKMWTGPPLPSFASGNSADFVSFLLVAGIAVSMSVQAAVQWWRVIMWETWSCSALLVKRFVYSISFTWIFMAYVLSYTTETLKSGASTLQAIRWVHPLCRWWEVLHFCHSLDILTLLSVIIIPKQGQCHVLPLTQQYLLLATVIIG